MLPKIAVPVPSKGALKVLPKIVIGNFSGGRNRQGALEVLPNANLCDRSCSLLYFI